MIHTFEILMVDLLFILLITLFTEMIVDTKIFSEKKRNIVYTFSFSLALLINFFFTVHIDGSFMMDLRHTVLLIGGLYGGVYTLPVLSILAISYISFYSPDEAMANTLTIIIEAVIIFCFSKYYHKWRLRKKMAVIAISVILVGFVIMKIIDFLFHFTTGYDFFIVCIYGGSMLILIYSIEWVRNSIAIKTRIQQTEKLEIVSHLAASVSHEIRNPLTVTKGFLQILETEEYPEEKKREFFSLARSELGRAEAIITDYLTFAKPSTNKMEILDVREELTHLIEVVYPFANMHSIFIESKLQPVLIKGEKQLFHQCIFNILKNAIEAMEGKGGTLVIESVAMGSMVEITISDTGIGMDKKQIQRLGEPYFSMKGKNGTGLGMMVVHSIIKSMYGKIRVESNLGKGTTFVIVFPRVNELK
jgi:two-component system, sporulation sensor kinase B